MVLLLGIEHNVVSSERGASLIIRSQVADAVARQAECMDGLIKLAHKTRTLGAYALCEQVQTEPQCVIHCAGK